MAYAQATGYVPTSVEDLLERIRPDINTRFSTNYTTENFVGSNHWKFAYAIAQEMSRNEIKASEIFQKLQLYFRVTNERISRPTVTPPGTLAVLQAAGYETSEKPMIDADAGKRSIAVNVDETDPDYALITKPAIAALIFHATAGGVVLEGTETSPITLTNGQTFTSKFYLPTRYATLLKLTITLSQNNQLLVESIDWIRNRLFNNVMSRYRMGLDFAPEKYFTTEDAPWASAVLLEYSINGGSTWSSAVRAGLFADLLVVSLANITIVEN